MPKPDAPVRIDSVPAQPAAWIRVIVSDVAQMVGAMDEFISWTRTRGHPFHAPIQFIYHDIDWEAGRTDVQIALRVNVAEVPPTGWTIRPHVQVEVGELPALPRAAIASLHGPYGRIAGAWQDLIAWIHAQELTPAMPIREVYAVGPLDTSNPDEYVTVLQIPLQEEQKPPPGRDDPAGVR